MADKCRTGFFIQLPSLCQHHLGHAGFQHNAPGDHVPEDSHKFLPKPAMMRIWAVYLRPEKNDIKLNI